MRSLFLQSYQLSINVLPLIRTLFDIALLRKGPDAIPRSSLLLLMAVGLWLFSSLAGLALIDRFEEADYARFSERPSASA